MLYPLSILSIFLLLLIHLTNAHSPHSHQSHDPHQVKIPSSSSSYSYDPEPAPSPDLIPSTTRTHWVRIANQALYQLTSSPCPFGAFGTVIVNHTDHSSPDGSLGRLVCLGVNDVASGNPTLHGEVAGINNCSRILRAEGRTGEEVGRAWRELSLYTNGEPCPMCATAIRWAGFKECIFSTSGETLTRLGWPQIHLSTEEVFTRSKGVLGTQTRLIKGVLANESDAFFAWQYDEKGACPKGCAREGEKGCVPVHDKYGKNEL